MAGFLVRGRQDSRFSSGRRPCVLTLLKSSSGAGGEGRLYGLHRDPGSLTVRRGGVYGLERRRGVSPYVTLGTRCPERAPASFLRKAAGRGGARPSGWGRKSPPSGCPTSAGSSSVFPSFACGLDVSNAQASQASGIYLACVTHPFTPPICQKPLVRLSDFARGLKSFTFSFPPNLPPPPPF